MFHIVAKIELSRSDLTSKPFANLNRAWAVTRKSQRRAPR